MAATWRALGNADDAETCQRQALAIWRETLGDGHKLTAKALAGMAALALDRGDAQAALVHAQEALSIRTAAPVRDDAAVAAALEDLGAAHAAGGDHAAAWRAFTQALAHPSPRAALLHVKSGISRRVLGDLAAAAAHFVAAIRLDPCLTAARHQLASTLIRLGRVDEAAGHRRAALLAQPVFVQPGPPGARRLLILATAESGNIPLDHVLPEARFTRIWWFIADAGPEQTAASLPDHDAVFNGIGDPDVSLRAQARAARFAAASRMPILNHPDAVAGTRRDRLPALLSGIRGVVTPAVRRMEGRASTDDIKQAAASAGMVLPVLLRPSGSHGGAGVRRIDDWSALDAGTPGDAGAWYISQFHDCRDGDGFVRKYRVIFVHGEPYAYHLAISRDWLVHYVTSDMDTQAWKLAEEARFLDDPVGVLGAMAWDAVRKAGERLGLAYGGMDFTRLMDGSVLVFEANATMLVHPEDQDGVLAFKNRAVSRIVQAMSDMLAQTAVKSGGDNVPPGLT